MHKRNCESACKTVVQHEQGKANAMQRHETCIHRVWLYTLATVLLTVLVIIRLLFITGVFPQLQHSKYTFTEYTTQQIVLRNKLYKLTPNNLRLTCKTNLTEYEAATVITDYLLYDPYSYWIQPDYVLTVSDGILYLNCKTDYTVEQCIEINAMLTEKIEHIADIAVAQKEKGVKAMYSALYEQLADIQLTDGTYRAPIKCCLIDRACNCQGLAYTFLYLCERVGLQADLQYGNYYGEKCVSWTVDKNALSDGTYVLDRSNAGHVWNVVTVDHVLYYIDIYAQIADNCNDLRFMTVEDLKTRYYLWDENVAQRLQENEHDAISHNILGVFVVVLFIILYVSYVGVKHHVLKDTDNKTYTPLV